MKRILLGAALLLWLASGTDVFGQSAFRHLHHNRKIKPVAKQTAQSKTVATTQTVSPRSLHPAEVRKPQSHKSRRRQRTNPERKQASSSELYLDIRRGKNMEKIKARNRRMTSGK